MKEWLGLEVRTDPEVAEFSAATAEARHVFAYFLLAQQGLQIDAQSDFTAKLEDYDPDPSERTRVARDLYLDDFGEQIKSTLSRRFNMLAEGVGGIVRLSNWPAKSQQLHSDLAIVQCISTVEHEADRRYDVYDQALVQAGGLGWLERQVQRLGLSAGPTAKRIGTIYDNLPTAAVELSVATREAGWFGFGTGRLTDKLTAAAIELQHRQLDCEQKLLF